MLEELASVNKFWEKIDNVNIDETAIASAEINCNISHNTNTTN